jgi:hypothetical protein
MKEHWVDKVLSGEKTWELRRTNCTKRQVIGLIANGTSAIQGQVRVVDSFPLSPELFRDNMDKHCYDGDIYAKYPKPHAWVFADPKRYRKPYHVNKPGAAQGWVILTNPGVVVLEKKTVDRV